MCCADLYLFLVGNLIWELRNILIRFCWVPNFFLNLPKRVPAIPLYSASYKSKQGNIHNFNLNPQVNSYDDNLMMETSPKELNVCNCQYIYSGIFSRWIFFPSRCNLFFFFEGWFRWLFQMYDLNGVYYEKADVRWIEKIW